MNYLLNFYHLNKEKTQIFIFSNLQTTMNFINYFYLVFGKNTNYSIMKMIYHLMREGKIILDYFITQNPN
jgi:hypothetical protein